MDLYKHAFRLWPLVGSDLVADCFVLAWDVREVDMRASPYDFAAWGFAPIRIETAEGSVSTPRSSASSPTVPLPCATVWSTHAMCYYAPDMTSRDPPLRPLGPGPRHRRRPSGTGCSPPAAGRWTSPRRRAGRGSTRTAPTPSSSALPTSSTSAHDRLRPGHQPPGASPSPDLAALDALRAEAAGHGWSELYADKYPHAGGDDHTALYLENSESFEVEVVVEA